MLPEEEEEEEEVEDSTAISMKSVLSSKDTSHEYPDSSARKLADSRLAQIGG